MENTNFRDSIGTVDEAGKRQWIYPKKPTGKWYRYRKTVSYFLLVFLFSAPFVKIGGNQLFLFNVLERKFSLFGVPFWPQDFDLFVMMMLIGVVFVIVFTVAFGRLFCGWICPQTIFMEMLFRRIEYWIEGDRGKQLRLSKMPWNREKILKKGSKWTLFFLISFLIANVFLAYLIGGDRLLDLILAGPLQNQKLLISLLIFTGVFYFVFAWFREQVCIIVCPYGRLQGVLLDNRSIVVAYDYLRGEKQKGRAKFNKREDRATSGKGDCIDCAACVHVCPTGIDIRNGTQLECVNCTACIDACNTIMDGVGWPQGLIRYTNENNIKKAEGFRFSNRLKMYSLVLTLLIGTLIGMFFLRNELEARILRIPGQLYQHIGKDSIRNVYTYKLINTTPDDIEQIEFRLLDKNGRIKLVSKPQTAVKKQSISEGTLFIDLEENSDLNSKIKLKVGVYSQDRLIETTQVTFLGPRTFN